VTKRIPFFNFEIMNAKELFFKTIQSGNIANINAQLSHNPQLVNSKDNRGFTPLIFATYFDQEEVAQVLIKHNAKIDDCDASGNTALLGVCYKGNEVIANHLIENGANINAKNNKGLTPLIFSVMYNREAIVRLLIDQGADKLIKDIDGKTAYDYAKEKGFKHLEELLK
jgi:ankyrin repeat protein